MDNNIICIGRKKRTESTRTIESTIISMHKKGGHSENDENINDFVDAMCSAICRGEKMIVPLRMFTPVEGPTLEIGPDDNVTFCCLLSETGNVGLVAYTDKEKLHELDLHFCAKVKIHVILQHALLNPEIDGVVINPWGLSVYLPKDVISDILEECSDFI